jgi:DNA-dependent protein kinase catalytic subunit
MREETEKGRVKSVRYAQLMMANLSNESRPFIGTDIGKYNRQYVKVLKRPLGAIFGENGKNLLKMNYSQYVSKIQDLFTKVNERSRALPHGTGKLSTFSEWLSEFDSNNFYDHKEYIEIPGQYDDDEEPYVDKNVKIASFNKSVLILGSIRRPKRITVHGSNEKEYNLMVKGGEDMRLDQRVQQVFRVMNKCYSTDSGCSNRNLRLKTF